MNANPWFDKDGLIIRKEGERPRLKMRCDTFLEPLVIEDIAPDKTFRFESRSAYKKELKARGLKCPYFDK